MSDEVWEQVYDRLAELVAAHRTTLVFVNTRRMAERVARAPGGAARRGRGRRAPRQPRQGTPARRRAAAEARRAEGAGRHRVARARHRHRRRRPGLPARLAALDRHLPAARRPLRPRGRRHAEGPAVPAVARRAGRMRRAARRVRRGELDRAARSPSGRSTCWRSRSSPRSRRSEWSEDELFALCRRAWPVSRRCRARTSTRSCACWPTASARGAAGAARCIHHDAVNGMLRGRRGARLTALTSGGAIPDTADYQVVLEPENQVVGTVNEDFAVESLAGDIFQLGNAVLPHPRVERGTVRVEDAQGAAADHPVLARRSAGRAPTSCRAAVSRLRAEVDARLRRAGEPLTARRRWLADEPRHRRAGGRASSSTTSPPAHAALGVLPTQDTHRVRALLRRSRRHAAGHPRAVRQPASTAPGGWRCASASAARSTSSCRRRRPTTPSCCR